MADPAPKKGVWYFVITVASGGLLAWVPFTHAARQLRRRSLTIRAVVFGVVAAVVATLLSLTPDDASGTAATLSTIGGFLIIGLAAFGCVQLAPVRQEVYGGPRAKADMALTKALDARARREQARKIVAKDPLLAHDLRIGRPDLHGDYDDGGLVDLNSASAMAIAARCELPFTAAQSIVDTREACGGYLTIDDVLTLADVPIETWEIVRDRGVVIRH